MDDTILEGDIRSCSQGMIWSRLMVHLHNARICLEALDQNSVSQLKFDEEFVACAKRITALLTTPNNSQVSLQLHPSHSMVALQEEFGAHGISTFPGGSTQPGWKNIDISPLPSPNRSLASLTSLSPSIEPQIPKWNDDYNKGNMFVVYFTAGYKRSLGMETLIEELNLAIGRSKGKYPRVINARETVRGELIIVCDGASKPFVHHGNCAVDFSHLWSLDAKTFVRRCGTDQYIFQMNMVSGTGRLGWPKMTEIVTGKLQEQTGLRWKTDLVASPSQTSKWYLCVAEERVGETLARRQWPITIKQKMRWFNGFINESDRVQMGVNFVLFTDSFDFV